jgi:urea transport system ATP-binding protein
MATPTDQSALADETARPDPAEQPGEALLAVRGLRVVFDGFVAIDGIDFTVGRGELRFLIGPNGAGKTTLVDVITGLTKPTSGSVQFAGTELVGRREHGIVRLGIGRTFQTATVFEELTVLENLDLAASFRLPVPALFRRRRGISDTVARVLETTELTTLTHRKAGVLSHGQRQWLEIGMLLAQDPRLLLLDEPVAGMTKDERERTGALLQQIAREHTVVVIEHDMEFLRRFARMVTVLHEGKVLMEGTVAEVQSDPRVQEVYLGRKAEDAAAPVAGLAAPTAELEATS